MRKQTKIAAIVSAATLLAIGASMTSFAAGWEKTGDYEWEYQDRQGNAIEEEGWHRGNSSWGAEGGAQYYYFADDSGQMVFDSLIEYDNSIYYVHPDGRRATNEWVQIELDESYPMADDSLVYDAVYYYFGSTGKAVHSDISDYQYKAYVLPLDNGVAKTGKFVFDENGVMQVGMVPGVYDTNKKTGTMYCAQPDDEYYITLAKGKEWNYVTGQALTGWAYMDVESMRVEGTIGDEKYDDQEWFYFDGNKLLKADTDEEFVLKKIAGVYYAFDESGVLKDEGVNTTATMSDATKGTDESLTYRVKIYANDDGEATDGNHWVNYDDDDWYYIVNIRDAERVVKERSVIFNYYVDPNGVTKNNGKGASRMIANSGARFMIGANGTMKTGAYRVTAEDVAAWEADAEAAKAINNYDNADNAKWDGTAYWNNIQYVIPTVDEVANGVITKRTIVPEGTYLYFNDSHDHNGDRGEQEIGKISYEEDGDTVTRFFTSSGKVDKLAIYGEYLYKDGLLVTAQDGDSYAAISTAETTDGVMRYTIKNNRPIEDKKVVTKDHVDDSYIIVDRNGKARKSSSLSKGFLVDNGIRYDISNYRATVSKNQN